MRSFKTFLRTKYRREQTSRGSSEPVQPQWWQSDFSKLEFLQSDLPERIGDPSGEETSRLARCFVQNQYHADRPSPMSQTDRESFMNCVETLLQQHADPSMTICVYEVGERTTYRILGARYEDDPVRGIYGGLENINSTFHDRKTFKPFQKPRLKSLLTPFLESIVLGDLGMITLLLHYGANARDLTRHFTLTERYVKVDSRDPLSVSRNFQLIRYLADDVSVFYDISVQTWVFRYLLEILGKIQDKYELSHDGKDFFNVALKEKIRKSRARAVFTTVPLQAVQLAEYMPLLAPALLDVMPTVHIAVALDSVGLLNATLGDGHDAQDTDWQQVSTLHIAVGNTTSRMCRHLLSLSVDVDARDCFGITPLQEAVHWGHLDAVRMLLDAGANIHPNRENLAPQETTSGHREVLFLGGEWRSIRNRHFQLFFESDWTILHIAVWVGSWPILRLLIDRGAALELQDLSGRTPLDLAIEIARFNIIANLLEAGAPFDNNCITASTLLEKAIIEREQHVIDRLKIRGVKRLPPDIHSPAYIGEGIYEDSDQSSVNPLVLPRDCTSDHMWRFYRRLPMVGCSHIQTRKSEFGQAESTASSASASTICNMCQLLNDHLTNSRRSIQLGATVELILRQIHETRRWELTTCIAGKDVRLHAVNYVPCM